jgi:hypothetical protein
LIDGSGLLLVILKVPPEVVDVSMRAEAERSRRADQLVTLNGTTYVRDTEIQQRTNTHDMRFIRCCAESMGDHRRII